MFDRIQDIEVVYIQPIFKEYTKFLANNGCDVSWYKDKTFWIDNNIIKAFDKMGGVISLYKISVDDDLNVSLVKHKQNTRQFEFETWDETVQRLLPRLQEIEAQSIDLLHKHCDGSGRRIINTNSTGKDSMVVTHLAQKAGLDFETYFNVTTLDVSESNLMAKRNGYIHILPDPQYGGFYKYIQRYSGGGIQMIPSRLNRFCCQYFKENPTIDYFDPNEKLIFLFGMRNQESQKRAAYEDTIRNPKWGSRDWVGVLPIRTWSEFDVWLYILAEGIEINDKYRYGYTRVGCGIACPNYTKYTWVLDKFWYPHLFSRWRGILRSDFIRNNKWLIMNCTINEYITTAWPGGVYRSEPTEEVVEEYARYSGLDVEISRKYFNKYCANGCINKRRQPMKIKDKDTLAMNMKLFGRHIDQFRCKRCLMKEFGWNQEQWNSKIDQFKRSGCILF